MRTLPQDNQQKGAASLCTPCVYYSKNLDPSFSPLPGADEHVCELGFKPGDDKCNEMRTSNCGLRKR